MPDMQVQRTQAGWTPEADIRVPGHWQLREILSLLVNQGNCVAAAGCDNKPLNGRRCRKEGNAVAFLDFSGGTLCRTTPAFAAAWRRLLLDIIYIVDLSIRLALAMHTPPPITKMPPLHPHASACGSSPQRCAAAAR